MKQVNDPVWLPQPTAEGLVGIGGDLSVPTLLAAYRRGIFPWSAGPLTWWSPDPRGIIELDQFHIPHRLARTLRNGRFTFTRNRAFAEVIAACANRPRESTWIEPEFIAAYTHLHRAGHAHSVECWLGDQLAGGVYGVSLGGLFAGESMFHRVPDAGKAALCHLMAHLRERRFCLFDIQMMTPATMPFGAREISRAEYLARLRPALTAPCAFD